MCGSRAQFPLIGAGGIDSGKTALAKIRAGADLIQLYSALVFHGLGLVGAIKAELLAALDRGEADTLADLVGVDAAAMTRPSTGRCDGLIAQASANSVHCPLNRESQQRANCASAALTRMIRYARAS